MYLVAIMDWHTRKVLTWRISNTLEAEFCVDALNEVIHKFGVQKWIELYNHKRPFSALGAPPSRGLLDEK